MLANVLVSSQHTCTRVGEGEFSTYRVQTIFSQARGEGEFSISQVRGVGEEGEFITYKVKAIIPHASSYSTHKPSPSVYLLG